MQPLRVNTAAVHVMATRWAAQVEELDATVPPSAPRSSCQASAAAVEAAHADIAAFTASLSRRVGTHSAHVGAADAGYLANDAQAANEMAAIAPSAIGT